MVAKNTGDFAPKHRLLQARIMTDVIQLFVPPDEETGLPKLVIKLNKIGIRSGDYVINLSSKTAEELRIMKEAIDLAFMIAEPLARATDKYVEENLEELSGDINSRAYRPVPAVVFGKRALAEYSEKLFDGPSDVLRRAGFVFSGDEGLPGSDSRVDEHEPSSEAAQDA